MILPPPYHAKGSKNNFKECSMEIILALLSMHRTWEHTLHILFIPVVPHKAAAEVSRIGNYRRDWLL